jgi:DNA-binding MarR family transcriptional regulator
VTESPSALITAGLRATEKQLQKRKIAGKQRHDSEAAVRRFLWAIRSVCEQVEQIDNVWAAKMGITGPQWLILTALADASDDRGTAVNRLAKALHVDPSFITTQTKLLERSGLLTRKPSAEDARVVLISTTGKFQKSWKELSSQRNTIHRLVFSKFGADDIDRLTTVLAEVESSLKIAATLAHLDTNEVLLER